MRTLEEIFVRNRRWADGIRRQQPGFFERLARRQKPQYLWIGCSDSRVPATMLCGLEPGEVFVHRNVANLVVHTDFNCLSVIQYAVEVLGVKHIIVCGHYGCGGVQAALDDPGLGLIDNWLRHIQDVVNQHRDMLARIPDRKERLDVLCELNVLAQVLSVARTTVVKNAWDSGRELSVHGWIYGLEDGRLVDMDLCLTGPDEISPAQERSTAGIFARRKMMDP